MTIYLKVEIGAGTKIQDAIAEAMALSEQTGAAIEFSFNGIMMYVRANGDAADYLNNYMREMHKVAEMTKSKLSGVQS